MANFYVDIDGTVKKKKKKANYSVSLDGKITENKADDIAPVKTTVTTANDKERTWFTKGAFDDGYQFGDIAKTTLGTINDVTDNVYAGILGMGEKVVDAGAYAVGGVGGLLGADDFKDKTKEFIAKDLYDEKKIAKSLITGLPDLVGTVMGLDSDENSLSGDKTDSLAQSGGQLVATMGLQAVGVPWWVTTGVTSFGGATEEAFKEDATYLEAGLSGAITAGADMLTEKLFGGSGLGEKGLINLDGLTKGISNKVVKALVDFGIDMTAEGTEEVVAGITSNLGTALYKEENLQDILFSEEAIDGYIESFIGGAVLGGGMNAGKVSSSIKSGKDYRTGLTENETKVVEAEVSNRIAEREADGTKLDNKEKSKIREEVQQDLERGQLNLDTIESVLGGETYESYKSLTDKENSLREEIATLQGNPSPTAQNRLTEAQKELEAIEKGTEKTELKDRLSLEVQELTKSERLNASYTERAKRRQKFEADVTQYADKGEYSDKAQKTVENAINGGVVNNTTRSHDIVDLSAKISAEKGIIFDFTNNENLKKAGRVLEGKTIDGMVINGDTIVINVDSPKAVNVILGHEVTHVLEGTTEYAELQEAFKQYIGEAEYKTRTEALTKLYKGLDANIENELTSNLVGEYLFTDSDFISNLSATKPNVFQKVFNEIKYLYKLATAGSKEARQLEKIKRAFEKAYKESSTSEKSVNVEYDISEDADGKPFVDVTEDILDVNNGESVARTLQKVIADKFNNLIDVNGQKIQINKTTNDEFRRSTSANALKKLSPQMYDDKLRTIANADEILKVANNWIGEKIKHDRTDDIVEFGRGNVQYRVNGKGYNADVIVGIRKNGSAVLYDLVDIYEKKIADAPVTMASDKNSQRRQNVSAESKLPQEMDNVKYSLSEDSGTLTESQENLIRGTHSLEYMKAYGKDTYSVFAYDKNDNTLYGKTSATKEELEQAFGEDIANEITRHKTDLMRFYLDEKFLNLPANKDTDGRKLSKEQQEYFKNVTSELKDDNGNLKVLYHGTPNEFTQFNYDFIGSNGTALGKGFYLTDSKDIASGYIGENGKVMELYANIEKPLSLTEKTITKAQYKKFVKTVDKATNGDYLTNYGEVDYDGYNNVLNSALNDYQYDDNDVDLIHSVFNAGGLSWEDGFRLLKKTLGYDGVVQQDFNGTGATVFVPTLPEQIKSVDNATPTKNPDIKLSLSKDNQSIAPVGNFNVYGKDIALETVPAQEIAPAKEVSVENAPTQEIADDFAPIRDTSEIDEQQSDRLYSLDESQMPDEVEAPFYEPEDVSVEDPFVERDIKDVGKRNVNAYMYDNPEVKPYFQEEAQNMLWELKNSVKGEKHFNDQLYYDTSGEQGWFGTKRETSDDIAYLLDNFGYTYADIEKGLNAIIEDHGAENNAISKRIEFAINDRLKDGYTDFMYGQQIPANQDYVNLLMDKQINTYSDEAYNQYLESLVSEYAPQDIAPVRQQYEAIEPAPQQLDAQEQEWANNKMSRVQDPNKVRPHKVEAKQRSWVETSTESEVVNREILPDDLDLSKIVYEPIPNKVTLGKANAKLGTLGYDEALTYFNSQLVGKKASLEDIALGERLLQEAMKKGDTATAGELIQNIAILGTELGQKVQALSIIQRLTPEGQLKMLHKTVKRGKVKGDKAFEGVELTQEMIDHILKTYKADGTFDQNELNKAVEDVKKKIADQMQVSGIDKVNAWRYLAMLGNPKTHIRNLVSNVAMKGTVAVKNAVARTFEGGMTPVAKGVHSIKDALTGKKTEFVAPIRTKTWKSATDEVKAFAETTTLEMKEVISEDTKYSEEASIKSKRNMFKNNILNKVYEFNNDLMTKEDWWFSKSAYKNSLSEYLTANGIETSKDIENNPKIVEKAKQYALEQSQIATFRQYSWLANKIRSIESKNVATEIAVGSILPFKKTPINIAKAGLSYSPLGFAKSLTYDMYQMKKGNMQASQVVDNLAQGVTGSALVYVGYMLAMSGLLSGGGEDDKEGSYDYQLGEQAYSLTIPEGKYDFQLGEKTYSINFDGASYSLSWLSPVAMPLFVGANAYEQLVEGEEWNGDVVMETLAQTLDPLSEMSFLSSLDSALSSYDSGVEKFAGIGETMLQSYLGQFIPTLSSQVASTLDDTKRSTKVAGDSDFELVDETINKLKYKIPFLRETLEPSTDIWGNEVKQSEAVIERALENFIAPYSRKENIATEIDAEIKDLYAQTGDDGIIPNIPNNSVNYDGEKYKMSAREYTDFKKTYGQTASDLLEELFETMTYQNATAEERVDLVNEVYDYASDTAKLEYLEKEGVDYEPSSTYGNIKGAIENDMSLDEFDLFSKDRGKYYISKAIGGYETYDTYKNALNDVEGDKDENGNTITGSKKANVESYINGLPLDYGQKILLFTSKYPKDDTYKADLVEYLNGRSDITYEEMKAILEGLNYTVEADGTVRW